MNTPRRHDPYIGRTFGQIRIDAKLGEGGMGMVYRGWHERFGKAVAVKILPPQQQEQQIQYQERFLREGRAAARIQHRHVVQVIDAGSTDDGTAYLVLEYVDGSNLGELLDHHNRLPPDKVQLLALAIAEGLAAIHAKEVVHRDIKPDNLLLGKDGVVKIADLGLARTLDDPELQRLTATGIVVGTPLYVAPEAIRDTRNAGAKADIYSLGATLYHLLAGRPPFTGATAFEVMRGHIDGRFQPLRDIDASIPRQLASLIHLCLAKNPDERPSAAELVQILKRRHTVHDGRGHTLGIMASAAAVLVASLAVIAWQLLSRPDGDDPGPLAATLELVSKVPQVELRIDDGPWRQLGDGRLDLAPGRYSLAARGSSEGRSLRWHQDLDLRANERRRISLSLSPIPVGRHTVSMGQGSGMLYLHGQALGLEDRAILEHAGTYHLLRFDGQQSWHMAVHITDDGSLESDHPRGGGMPDGPGWWTSNWRGREGPRHHLCCWWEVDQARSAHQLAPSNAWARGSARPAAPASNLDPGLVLALARSWQGHGARLPDRSEAEALSALYDAPLWFSEQGQIAVLGGAATSTALLALVPDEPRP